MGWVTKSVTFHGVQQGSIDLSFASGDAGFCGPALDNVSAVASIPDGGSTCALLGLGLMGVGFLRRKLQAA